MWVRLSQRQTLSRAMRAGGLLGCPVLTPQGCKEGYLAARGAKAVALVIPQGVLSWGGLSKISPSETS